MQATPDRPAHETSWARFLELKNRAHRNRREETELALLRNRLLRSAPPFLRAAPASDRLT